MQMLVMTYVNVGVSVDIVKSVWEMQMFVVPWGICWYMIQIFVMRMIVMIMFQMFLFVIIFDYVYWANASVGNMDLNTVFLWLESYINWITVANPAVVKRNISKK